MDAYERKARLYPAAAVVFPLALLGLVLFSLPEWWKGLVIFAAAGGLHVLVIQVVHDLGAGKQEALWASWGGAPTTQLLRWAGKMNLIQQQRHMAVEMATGIALPTEQEETADPAGADVIYESAVEVLRAKTRGGDFALVKAENANYGFRRNLYGCRPFGIGVAGLVCLAEVVLAVLGEQGVLEVSPALMILTAVISATWLAGWVFIVTRAFVRRDGERYAQALILAASTVKKA